MQLVRNVIEIKKVVIITMKILKSNGKSKFSDYFDEHRKVYQIHVRLQHRCAP